MNSKNYLEIILLMLSIGLLACHNDEDPSPPQDDVWNCDQAMTLDSLEISRALVGEWEWEYIRCFWFPGDANDDQYQGVAVKFDPDGTLTVSENGEITQTSTWRVVDSNTEFWVIETEPYASLLSGQILLCNDRVIFSDSYVDGCDNTFRRTD